MKIDYILILYIHIRIYAYIMLQKSNYDINYLHSKRYKKTNPLKTVKYLLKSINKGNTNSYLELGKYYNIINAENKISEQYFIKSILKKAENRNYSYIELAHIKPDYFLHFIYKGINNKCQAAYVEYLKYLYNNNKPFIKNHYDYFINKNKYIYLKPEIYIELTFIMYKTYEYTNKYMSIYYLDLIFKYTTRFNNPKLYINSINIFNKVYLAYKNLYLTHTYEIADHYLMKAMIINSFNMNNNYINSYFNHTNTCFLIEEYGLVENLLYQIKIKYYNKLNSQELFIYNFYNYIFNYKTNNPIWNTFEKEVINQYINIIFDDNTKEHIKHTFNIKHCPIYVKELITCPILYGETDNTLMLKCGHKFSFHIFNWLITKNTCPTCRAKI